MIKRQLFGAFAGLLLLASFTAAQAQQTGALIGGGGAVVFKTLQMPIGSLLVGQGQAADPAVQALSGDCTISSGGVISCTKTNGANLGSAATAATGTSGTALGLLNTINTYSADQVFGAHVRVGASTPSLSACGTGSPAIIGDDTHGEVTMGTTATGCVITFASAYAAAPLCTVSWEASPLASQSYAASASALTLTQTSTSGNKAAYDCRARNAG